MMNLRCWSVAVLGVFFLGGCSLAPVYKVPTVSIPTDSWKDNPWQLAQPADDLPRARDGFR